MMLSNIDLKSNCNIYWNKA